MPRQIDDPDRPSTVPPPELNPLLNPVLGRNMGRWAEVYFTAPPEKREQAVQELLRELESPSSPPENAVTPDPPQQRSAVPALSASRTAAGDPKLICGSCGNENPPKQKFCGMCGVALSDEAPPEAERPAASRTDEPQASLSEVWVEPSPKDRSWQEQEAGPLLPTEGETNRSDDGLDHLFGQSQPLFSYSYRIFVGGALAVLVVILAYMVWRSGQAASGLSQAAPKAAPASATQPEPPAPSANNIVADTNKTDAARATSHGNTSSRDVPPGSSHEESSHEESSQKESTPVSREADNSGQLKEQPAPLATGPAEKSLPAHPIPGNGSEELATAERYLNGTYGQRNPSAAVEWLWKAIAKRNSNATMLLSDLYLKGDGIPKNCDQARVLLDAAARSGRKDAGERLRHMQAFGCE